MKVLQSHGKYDSILPFAMGEALRNMLVEAGAGVEFVPFDGDHEISEEVLARVASFIAGKLEH